MRRLGHDHLERSGSHLPDLTSPDMIGFRHRPAMSSAAVRLLSSPGIERAWAAALGYPLVQEGRRRHQSCGQLEATDLGLPRQ